MATLSVELTDDEGALLDRLVAKAAFPGMDEAFAEGLRLLERDEAPIATFVEQINWVHQALLRGEHEPGLDEMATRRAFSAVSRAWEAEVSHSRWQSARDA